MGSIVRRKTTEGSKPREEQVRVMTKTESARQIQTGLTERTVERVTIGIP